MEAEEMFGASRKISHKVAPWGAIVGEMPLKVIGPPWMMVIVPMLKRAVSALGVATMVRIAGVVLMPEFRVSEILPVLLVSCWDWALMTICKPGNLVWSGSWPGAV